MVIIRLRNRHITITSNNPLPQALLMAELKTCSPQGCFIILSFT